MTWQNTDIALNTLGPLRVTLSGIVDIIAHSYCIMQRCHKRRRFKSFILKDCQILIKYIIKMCSMTRKSWSIQTTTIMTTQDDESWLDDYVQIFAYWFLNPVVVSWSKPIKSQFKGSVSNPFGHD